VWGGKVVSGSAQRFQVMDRQAMKSYIFLKIYKNVKVELSLYQAVEPNRLVRRRGSHMF
jgi:hypothetical protein